MKLISGAFQRLIGIAFGGVLLVTAAGAYGVSDKISPREREMLGTAYVAVLGAVEDGARNLRMSYYDESAPAPTG